MLHEARELPCYFPLPVIFSVLREFGGCAARVCFARAAAGLRGARLQPYEKLQRHWIDNEDWIDNEEGIRAASTREQAVDGLERKYGVRLPDDFKAYLVHCHVRPAKELDQDLIAWWPMDRVKNIADQYPHPIRDATIARDSATYLFFADYLIWSWAWAIACGDDEHRGRVVLIGGINDQFIADSFAEFVDRYIDDYQQIC